MSERYDIAIIGSGPAGLSAAINGKIRNKKVIIFGVNELSSKLVKAPKINNYLGYYNISGEDLKNKYKEHINYMDINITNERINAVYAMGEYFSIMVNEKVYESTTVLIATGMEYTKPIKGEEQLLGKGVGYCATCDAPLYKGKIVTIIGYNNEAEKEVNYVNEISGTTYYIPMYRGEYNLNQNIEVITQRPMEIVGKNKVEKIILNNREIVTDGVFILKDSISPEQLVPGLEVENGHIKVSRDMSTNIEGCFACGDCTGKPYQYMKAAGEGQVAALSAVNYIDEKKLA